jgi:predicted porin
LYRTLAEGRGILNMQSKAHGGAGTDGQGRQEQTLQYTTPKMGGFEVVLNTTVSAADAGNCTTTVASTVGCDETIGAGIRWSNKSWLAYFDYLDPNAAATGAAGSPAPTAFLDESIMKVGGKWTGGAFQVSAQYEMTEDQTGGDYMFLNGLWNINKNNIVTASYGAQDKISDAFALAYVHVLGKQTNVYAGYGSVSADTAGSYSAIGFKEDGSAHDKGSVITLGMRKSF